MQIDTTVLGGLPVTVEFSIQPADTSVGIMSADLEDWSIIAIGGRKRINVTWLLKRLTEKDIEKIEVACYDSYINREVRDEPDYDDELRFDYQD